MTYLITFHTHLGALSCAKALRAAGFEAKMMPVPRAVSSSCGTGVRARGQIDFSAFASGDIDAVFEMTDGGYREVYRNPD